MDIRTSFMESTYNNEDLNIIARLIYPSSKHYTDYEVYATITYKDNTTKTVKVDLSNKYNRLIDGTSILELEYDGGEYLEKKVSKNSNINSSTSSTTTSSSNVDIKKQISKNTSNPNTHDNIIKYVSLSLISIVGIIIIFMLIKHRKKTS